MEKYITKKTDLYCNFLGFLENDDQEDKIFLRLINIFQTQNIGETQSELKDLLFLISKVSKHHHRGPNFNEKINKILLHFENQIKQAFSNLEIFQIFKSNKLLLLFLYEHKFISTNEIISFLITNKSDKNFDTFFYPEIQSTLSQKQRESIELKFDSIKYNDEDFIQNRQIGENENYICSLIREDSIDDFIVYCTRKLIPLSSYTIQPSLFESNPILEGKNLTLLEYSAFCGSIMIFQYLLKNNVLMNRSLWIYVIHSNKPELIHLLEDNKILPIDESYYECLIESIKCHHNDFAKYIENNLMNQNTLTNNKESILETAFKYCNYFYFQEYINEKSAFLYSSVYGYSKIVDLYIEMKKDEIEKEIIFFFTIFLSRNFFLL